MMKKNNRFDVTLLSAAVASLFSLSMSATAQDSGKPAGVPWGPVMVYPEADVTFKSNDNIYSQPTTKKSSNITVLAPKVKLEAKTGPHTFDASYRLEHGAYSGASSANYTDQGISANAAWVFSGRSGLKLSADYQLGHDDQGAIPGATTHTNPDKWHQSSFSGKAGFGAEGAQGRIEVDAGVKSKRYDNYKTDSTTGLPDNTKRDRDDNNVGATFYWRVMPKTQLLFQATQTKYDYKPDSFAGWTTLDSTDRSYLVGVTWEAAAKTTGIFKIGSVKKDFSDAARKDFSGSSWDGTVKWSPLTYSSFDFNTGKTTGESTIGNASLDTKYGVTWNHAWNSRLSSVASYTSTKNVYQNNAGIGQTDKTNALGLKVNYQWLRTVKVGAAYDRTDKTSDALISNTAYKRNIYSVFLNAAI